MPWVELLAVGIVLIATMAFEKRAALEAAERMAAVAHPDVLPFASTGQADVVREHLTWLQALPLANVGATSASAAAQLT